MAVLALLRKEVPEHGRHIAQYFHLFLMYANLGAEEVWFILFISFLTDSVGVHLIYQQLLCVVSLVYMVYLSV